MIKPDQDLVVRLESALTLKMAIDDYNYDPNQLVEFQHEACTNLFNLLVNCEGMGSSDGPIRTRVKGEFKNPCVLDCTVL